MRDELSAAQVAWIASLSPDQRSAALMSSVPPGGAERILTRGAAVIATGRGLWECFSEAAESAATADLIVAAEIGLILGPAGPGRRPGAELRSPPLKGADSWPRTLIRAFFSITGAQ